MHQKIYFKFNGGKRMGDAIGWLALGAHGSHSDGTRLLSCNCHSFEEFKEQAGYLKHLIDEAVNEAKKKLP